MNQKTSAEQTLFPTTPTTTCAPIHCLGQTFPDDNARREHFLGLLREKLKDPEFRKIEGFPIGSDEDILAMSDPPYYTACPNPFLADLVREWSQGKDEDPSAPYSRNPLAIDASEGKTDPLYKAHGYHTKVPHKAIVRAIVHYTDPGDIVLDGFCGSGMTGVAAQVCANPDPDLKQSVELERANAGLPAPVWGPRHAVLNDLSPAATFIAANYCLPFDVEAFAKAGKRILSEVEKEIGWMYETRHVPSSPAMGEGYGEGVKGRIEYTVWSEVFTCPDCAGEVVFLEEALEKETKRVRDSFPCPHCGSELNKDRLERVFESSYDSVLNQTLKRVKFQPCLITYKVGKTRYEKTPDKDDLKTLEKIRDMPFPPEVPSNRFPIEEMYHGSRIGPKGFTHVHHFFLPRAAQALAALWRKANSQKDSRLRNMLLYFVEQAFWSSSVCNSYRPTGFSQVSQYMKGIYYVPSQHSELSPWYLNEGKLKRLDKVFSGFRQWDTGSNCQDVGSALSTGTTAHLNLPDDSIDYIFTDPPFGENIYYADLNFLVESWHRVQTSTAPEAIVDKAKDKDLPDYQKLMQRCFEEYERVLKPGRWMTVVFHNSRNAVWNAIQEALQVAGFVVADVRTLDKQQGSYRQVTSTAVKQDLVISAYKPNGGLEDRFEIDKGTEEGVWDFVRTHLRQLPVFVAKDGQVEVIAERQDYLLFDRMVAFHVQRGVTVPVSASEFYQGLAQRFAERDRMYFLSEQAAEYDRKRMNAKEVEQLELFVKNEETAIQWLRQQLQKKPQSFQELHPQFIKEIAGWEKFEKPMELSRMLEENFLVYDGKGEVPPQIHSYLSTTYKELRNLPKDTPSLQTKGKNRWFVPDPNKASDLEKVRERALLKEFWEYLPPGYERFVPPDSDQPFLPGLESKPDPIPKGKRLKVIRLEAVRAGFKHCWQNRDYRTIIAVAQRISETILQEDPKLLMWYDQAVTRMGEE